jgi:multimeric flavodoxin WrbA
MLPMAKELLAIFGSPRKGGNSDALLRAVLPAFEETGFRVEEVRTAGAGVRPCLGCLSCEKTGSCVQKDGMLSYYSKLLGADVILFSSPVYFYSVPGDAKVFIDRCQALWALKNRFPEKFREVSRPGRRGYFLGVGATHGKKLFQGMGLTFRYFFDAVGAEMAGKIVLRGLEEKGDFKADAAHAARAREWAEERIREIQE